MKLVKRAGYPDIPVLRGLYGWIDAFLNWKHFIRTIIFAFTMGFSSHLFADTTASIEPLPLSLFIHQALENNPAMKAAQANIAAAEARQTAAGLPLYNPALTAEAQQATDKIYAVTINQTVDWANKRDARKQVQTANLQVAESQLRVLRQQLTTDMLNALAQYQTAQKVVDLAKQRTQLLQQFVRITEKRHQNGDVARVDVDLAQLALSQGLAQQADAEVDLSQSLQKLRSLTGLTNPASCAHFSSRLPSLSFESTDIEKFINGLPAIQVLSNQYLSAQSRIHLAQRERYADPTVGIQGGVEDTNDGKGGLVGLTLSIPLYVRNPYRAEVDAANQDAIEVEQKRLDALRQVRAQIRSSAERYQILYHTDQEWRELSNKPLSNGMELIERLWQSGEINTTDYLVQFKQRIDSQIAGVELRGRAWQAWIDWLNASGTIETWVHSQ